MNDELYLSVYTGDPGSTKLPPKYRTVGSGSSSSLALTGADMSPNSPPHVRATAMLLAGASFLHAANGFPEGNAHAESLRKAGLNLQRDAADLINGMARPRAIAKKGR